MTPSRKSNFKKQTVKFLSAREAAERLGCSPDYIGRLCREGKLGGVQVAGAWRVTRSALELYEAEREQSKIERSNMLSQERRSTLPATSVFGMKPVVAIILASLLLGGMAAAAAGGASGFGSQAAALAQVRSPFFSTGAYSFDLGDSVAKFFSALVRPAAPTLSKETPAQTPRETAQTITNNTTNNYVTNNYTTNSYGGDSYVFEQREGGEFANEFNQKLNSLRAEIYSWSGSGSLPSSGGSINNIALSQIINKLSDVTITNSTVNGLSGLTDGDIPDSITVAGYLPLAGGTLTGGLTGTTGTFSTLNTTGFTATNATTTNFWLSGASAGCAEFDANGKISSTGTTCSSGGGSDGNWSFFNGSGIRLATTTNQVVVGSTSTSTSYRFQVVGGAYFDNATTTNFFATSATTTNLSTTNASTTNLTVSSLGASAGQCLTINSSGTVTTTTCGSGDSFPFTTTTNFGATANSTSTPIWFRAGLQASSTARFVGIVTDFATSTYASSTALTVSGTGFFGTASTTNLTISSVASGNLLKTTTGGAVTAAVAGTDYITLSLLEAAYPFQLTGNATSTLTQFNGGLTAFASSTIGAGGAKTGLTISGGATTTGNLLVQGTSAFTGAISAAAAITSTAGTANTFPYASSTALTVSGTGFFGTASTTNLTISGLASTLLSTNSTGVAQSTTVSSPLSFSGSTLSITQANASTNGYLSSADWSVFNNKISSTSLSATFPLAYNSSTGAFTYDGLATTSTWTTGQLAYVVNGNTVSSVATGTISSSGGITVTAGRAAVGGALSIVCTSASGSATGCLSSADWSVFNNKISSTSLSAGAGISYNSSTGVITNTNGYPFTPTTNFGATAQATTGIAWFQNGLQASSTSRFVYASSTALTISGTASTLLSTGGDGGVQSTTVSSPLSFSGSTLSITQANSSTNGYLSSADWNTFNQKVSTSSLDTIFPFTTTTNFGATANSTSTPIWFRAGLQASSTARFVGIVTDFATSTYASTTALTVSGTFWGANLSTCASSADKLLWTAGQFSCGTDQNSGGAGSEINWAWFNGSGVRLGTTTNQVLVGASATTSLAALEVIRQGTSPAAYFLGNVGVGTTSPYASLSVAGRGVFNRDISSDYFTATSTTVASTFPYASTTALTVSDSAYFPGSGIWNSTGSVGVGTTSPYSKLTAWGAASLFEAVTNASTTVFSVGQNGATTTNLSVANTASTTSLVVSGLGSGAGNCLTPNSAGVISTQSCANFGFPYTTTTNFGATANSTTTPIWFRGGLQASSTARFSDTTVYGTLDFASTSTTTVATFRGDTFITAAASNIQNTSLGRLALGAITSGDNNTAVGDSALSVLKTGVSNNAFGTAALLANVSGSRNAAFGTSALINATGDNNVAFGSGAGRGVTTGYANLLIGTHVSANSAVTTGAGNIGIGNELYFPSTTANNQLNIGGILFGTLPATTTLWTLPTSGTVGIGTTSPTSKFGIAANNGDTVTTLFQISSSTSNSTTTLFSIDNTGLITGLKLALTNGTSTNFNVSNSFTAYASSTIGAGTAKTGLTISGGATTTGNLLVQGTSAFTGAISAAAAITSTAGTANTFPYASSTALTVSGTGFFGTASTTNLTISGLAATLLSTNSTGVAQSTTVSAPLSFSGSTLSITQANSSTNGYLSSADWNIFNQKVSTSSLESYYPFQVSGNATSTLTQFNGGLTAYASSTIGAGTAKTGLTISGGATSTLSFNVVTTGYFFNNTPIAIGSTTKNNYFFAGASTSATLPALLGTDNLAFGEGALAHATSSSVLRNIAVGYQALMGSETVQNSGDDNIAIGYQALTANTTGNYNNAIGYRTLMANTSGTSNNAFGLQALTANTTGTNNNALGSQTLFVNTTGSDNNAFGVSALTNNTTGFSNNALGTHALLNNTTGSYNVALGYQALLSNETADFNTALGYRALMSNTTGTNNTGVGRHAGRSVTTGYSNTLVGDNSTTNSTITTGFGNLGLGSNVFFPSATANSQLNIGNILMGTLPATSTLWLLPTSGTVGIGTTSPTSKFGIAANNGDTLTTLFQISSSTSNSTTTLFQVSNTGVASTTSLVVSGLGSGAGNCLTPNSAGVISTQSCANFGFPYTTTTNYGATANATGTPIWFQNGLQASSTSHFVYASSTALTVSGTGFFGTASTTNLTISGLASTLLSTNSTGVAQSTTVSAPLSFSGSTLSITQANASTNGYLSSADWSVFNNKISSTSLSAGAGISYNSSTGVITNTNGYPFTPTTNFGATAQATTGIAWFQNGLQASSTSRFVYASSTALTVSGHFYGANLSTCASSGDKLLWTEGQFSCGADGGGTGSDLNWTYFNGTGVRLATTTNQVIIGATATSSGVVPLAAFNVIGGAGFDKATSTSFFATTASTTNLYVGGDALFGNSSNVGLASSSPWARLSVGGGLIVHTAGTSSVATSTPTTDHSYASVVSGGYLYVADNAAGVKVYDNANPRQMVLVGSYTGISGAVSIAAAGRYLYVGDTSAGLVILDVTNPSSPALVGSYAGGDAYGIALSGRYAYISNQAGGNVRIIDVSDPRTPKLIGTYQSGGNPYGLAVAGRYLYVANQGNNLLQIVDVSNIQRPVLVGSYTGVAPTGVTVSGRYAYLANAGGGLRIINISNPASPALVGTFGGTGDFYGVAIAGDYAYVADFSGTKFYVVDVRNPANPRAVATSTFATNARSVALGGRYAYVATSDGGIKAMDISGTETPTARIGAIEAGEVNINNNLVVGNNLYAGGGLDVGLSGIFSRGPISAFIASTTESGTTSPTVASFMGGNVGIGTSSPYAHLSVAGSGVFNRDLRADYYTATSTSLASTFPYASTTALTIAGLGFFDGGFLAGASSTIGNGNAGLTINGAATTTGRAYFAGDVGVGTTSPWAKLSVSTTAQQSGSLPLFAIASTTKAPLFTVLGNGNIGIATTAPVAPLDIYGNAVFSGANRYLNFGATSTNSLGTDGYGFRDNSGTLQYKDANGSWASFAGSTGGGQLLGVFSTSTPSTVGTDVRVVLTGTAGTAPSFSGGTLTLPSNTSHFIVEIWGGGGGGASSGAGNNGAAGDYSHFGTGLATTTGNAGTGGSTPGTAATTCNGGSGGPGGDGLNGDLNVSGGNGVAGEGMSTAGNSGRGGIGGVSARGGSTFGGGGGGAAGNSTCGGGGGGGGGYTLKFYASPSGTYFYKVGAGGAGGTGGSNVGADGATGGVAIYVYTTGISQGAIGGGTAGYLPYYNSSTASTSLSATSSIFLSTAGFFGIGSTTPWGKLSVQGTSGQSNPLLEIASSTKASLFSISSVGAVSLSGAITSTAGTANTFPYASSTALTVSGTGFFGTASTTNLTISGLASTLLSTNSTGVAQSTTVSSPLSFSGSTLSITQANASTNGYLSSADWSVFNNKISSTSLSATFPLAYNSSTGAFTYGGLSTSTALTTGRIPYVTSANTFADVATGTISAGSGISVTAGQSVIGSGLTITNLIGYPFTPTTNFGATAQATTGIAWFQNGLQASSTSRFVYASSTALTISGTGFFDGGFLAFASSTIGAGTQITGLTISGGATTTGNAYIAGNTSIGTTSPFSKLTVWGGSTGNIFEAVTSASSTALRVSATGFGTTTLSGLNISGSATSTSNVGFNLTAGCFAISGSCLSLNGASTTLLSDTNTWTGLNAFNGGLTAFASSTIGAGGTKTGLTISGNATTTGAHLVSGALTVSGATTLSSALTYGGVTLSNSVTGTGSMVLSASPALTGTATLTGFISTASSTIGNGLSGLTITGAATTTGRAYFADTVGVGTTTPWAKFAVQGTAGQQNPVFEVASSSIATKFLTVSATGFGTTTLSGLNISGSATSTSNVGYNITTGCYAINGTCVGGGSATLSGSTGQVAYFSATDTAVGTSTLTISTASNVGIGTSSPVAKFDIYGNAAFSGANRYLNFGATSTNSLGTDGYGFRDNAGTIEFKNSGGTWQGVTTATTGPSFMVHKNGTNQTGITAGVETLLTWSTETFDTNNNFDLSTERFTPTVPGKYLVTLNVYCSDSSSYCQTAIRKGGAVIAYGLTYSDSTEGASQVTTIVDMNGTSDYLDAAIILGAGSTANGLTNTTYFTGTMIAPVNGNNAAGWTNDGTQSVLLDTADKVGIGTTTPWAKFAVTTPAQQSGSLPLLVVASTTKSELFTVLGSGNVGIGNSAPSYALDVAGDVNVSSGSCFRVNGVCIGYVKRLAGIYATSTPGSNVSVTKSVAGLAFSGGALTIPASSTEMVVEIWGGGGGGGGARTNGVEGGGGGGGGGYSMELFGSLGTQYYYTIGTGGAGGAAGSNAGVVGDTSCFGTNSTACTTPALDASGGGGGAFGDVGSPQIVGGTGGVGSGGNINMTGAEGDNADNLTSATGANGGNGGSAPRGGGGGRGGAPTGNGSSDQLGEVGAAFGGGGGGGGGDGATGYAGARGGHGGIVITVYATSSPTAAGNDYAEMFPVSNPGISAGDIVAVDAGAPITMKLAEKGDAALAGIIATEPGQLLGDINAQGERPVGLAGRVPTKVNLEGGAIRIGDRIALSSVAGVGKRAGVFESSVGIALEEFNENDTDGLVMVFIDLQTGVDVQAVGQELLKIPVATTTASSTDTFDFVASLLGVIADRFFGTTATSTATTSSSTNGDQATTTDPFATTTLMVSSSTPQNLSPVERFFTGLFAKITEWLGSASNGIGDLFATHIHAEVVTATTVNAEELCLDGLCINKNQLENLLNGQPTGAASSTASGEAPVVTLQGNNPATVEVGASYVDLGAIITDDVDQNLGFRVSLNGGELMPLESAVVDTSVGATHYLRFVAEDSQGNIGSATRTIIVGDGAASSTPQAPTEEPPAENPPAEDPPVEGGGGGESTPPAEEGSEA